MEIEDAVFLDLARGYQSLEQGDFIAHWTGFLFVRGCVAGEASVARILDLLRKSPPEKVFAHARGSFALCVFDKNNQSLHCAVDPFGLMRLFVSNSHIGDDLFALIRRMGADRNEIDRAALASFLRFGFYDRQRTFDRRVRVLAGHEIVHCGSDGDIRYTHKMFADESNAVEFDFDSYMRDVSTAIEGERVSLDLTGGFDSRLVAVCLAHAGASLAEAVTAGQEGNRDLDIAAKIAAELDLPHIACRHVIAGFDDRVFELLRLTHGQMGVITYDHMFQIQQGRLARGMTLSVGGQGGELWKDFLWLQDFPFLSGSPDFDRLYKRRFEPRPPFAAHLAPSFAPYFASASGLHIEDMRQSFGGLRRTAAYDMVYADLRLPFLMGPSVTAGIRAGLPHFAPLLDREGVRASINKPVGERLFARWHRTTLARAAPALARERTTDGLSARTGIFALADLPFYVGNKMERLAQKIAQRLNLPDVVRLSLDDPQALASARTSRSADEAFRRLREFGILADDAAPDRLPRGAFDRALTGGLTLLEIMP